MVWKWPLEAVQSKSLHKTEWATAGCLWPCPVLNVSGDVDPTAHLGNLQCLVTFTIKKLFLMFKQNFQYFNLCPVALILWLATTQKSLAPLFLLSLIRQHADKIPPSFPFLRLNSPSCFQRASPSHFPKQETSKSKNRFLKEVYLPMGIVHHKNRETHWEIGSIQTILGMLWSSEYVHHITY